MNSQMKVPYTTINGDTLSIPIQYSLQREANGIAYQVMVIIKDEGRPDWLNRTEFSTLEHYSPGDAYTTGVTSIHYNQQTFSSADEAAFLVAAIEQIRLAEKVKADY